MIKLKPKLNIDWCQHRTVKNDESINPHAFNIISVTKINYFKLVACPWINSAVSAVAKNPPTDGEKQSRIWLPPDVEWRRAGGQLRQLRLARINKKMVLLTDFLEMLNLQSL